MRKTYRFGVISTRLAGTDGVSLETAKWVQVLTGLGHKGLRTELGIGPEEYLLLQPTRVVPRKRIEVAIELTLRLELDCSLLISHHSGDEGLAYEAYLRNYACLMDVKVFFAADLFDAQRNLNQDGTKIYSLADALLWSRN